MSKSDVTHFAATNHKGLPQHKEAGKHHGFYHMVRRAQAGERPISEYSPAVAAAARKMEPKDATSSPVSFTPKPQVDRPPEVSSKMSSYNQLAVIAGLTKLADVHSILARSHKAVQQAGLTRRQQLVKEIDRLNKHNQKLQTDTDKAHQIAEDSKQKVRESEMKVIQAGKTIEQIQAMQMAQRPAPPPEQPAYGSMLLNGSPGVQPAITPSQPAAAPAAPPAPSIPGMQPPPQV